MALKKTLSHPNKAVALGFLAAIFLGTLLLFLPLSHSDGLPVPLLTAFFTAVSAVCVTGLVIVDTGTYWSFFGQIIILFLIQIGGFGMMTAATLLGLLVNRSLRLRTRLIAQAETKTVGLGDVISIAKVVFFVTFATQGIIAVFLSLRFYFSYGFDWHDSLWQGIFHAISAFNNAGFALYEDGLSRFYKDFLILLPIMACIFIGGIGFPVLHDIYLKWNDPKHWSLHTKMTLLGTLILLFSGFGFFCWFEWDNPATFGFFSTAEKMLGAAFASVSARTAGFNAIDIGALTHESFAVHYFLMFIGGGSAGTAGGVKVTTMMILALIVYAEVRGRSDVEAFGRRISSAAQRQAITVLVLSSFMVVAGTTMLLRMSNLPSDEIIFEAVSAFATVGLSTGITAELPPAGQLVLTVLMYVGRVGTITLAVWLAFGEQRLPYRYPEEHPIVG
jgi:trk system potassium uptake protein